MGDSAGYKQWLPRLILLTILCLGLIWVAFNWRQLNPQQIKIWVDQAGSWAPIYFMLLFALSALLFIPATVMVLAGSVLFGPWWGAFYNIVGATLGAVCVFLFARYVASDWALRNAGDRLRKIMRGASEEGWKFVLFIRLAGFPYFVLNYMLGVTPLKFSHFTLGTFFGLAPSMVAVSYAAHVGFDAATGGENPMQKIALAIVAIGIAALIPIALKIYKKTRKPVEH
ncbi:MAG: putative membrane protein YdjX (TVP38/TMEM64 family) [Parasphingorhabdus sp.]|jgi:uncharacterized membrane protein YdjX (TVP38/TMEM64 family)